MSVIEITCPGCEAVLKVPAEAIGKKGRCSACRTAFPILPPVDTSEAAAARSTTPDDTILGWLADGITAKGPGDTQAGTPRRSFAVDLDHVDAMGAFFRFHTNLLYDEDFRVSLPQQCIICSAKQDLSIHLIVWSNKLAGRGRTGAAEVHSLLVKKLDELADVKGRDLLAKLPMVENVPEPYCLPFPYYVCKNCSAIGAVVTDVHVSPDGRGEECELGISSLSLAERFSARVCGPTASAVSEIRRARKERKGDPWRRLPLSIRVRIQRWYQPAEGEKFVAYFPDADYTQSEAGLAGVVLTDQRLVYHKSVALTEMPLTERITVSARPKGQHVQVEILSASGDVARLTAQQSVAEELQRLLGRQSAVVR